MDPSNWTKWEDRFDAFVLEGTLRTGSQIKAKIKNKPIHIKMLVAEVRPYHECKFLPLEAVFELENKNSDFTIPVFTSFIKNDSQVAKYELEKQKIQELYKEKDFVFCTLDLLVVSNI